MTETTVTDASSLDKTVGPVPELDELNSFFWTSGEDGKLRMQYCDDCQYWQHPPSVCCRKCLGEGIAAKVMSGKGTVAAITVNRMPWMPGLKIPYLLVIIELDEQPGLRLTSAMPSAEPGSVRIGDRVKVSFEQREDVWMPFFELQ
ncbi:OB-fold domain-containing protein [Zhongshania sp.]|uniref:OB-fold domain-containing protein n=1 Tax=Zhongshania guokunii TaxID=641783 RepID=A0ABV3UAR9_9GAMM|nr:OB-fold domain-containing protein [Zhongshania sp.]MBQ0797487.1 OB-fold domain-containing protein [Zhongshania sp.]